MGIVLPPLGTAALSVQALYSFRGRTRVYRHEWTVLRGYSGTLEALLGEAELGAGGGGRSLAEIDFDFRALALRTEQSLSFEMEQWMLLMERPEHEVAA